MSAVEPWSGNYYVGAPIWSTAHTTHFAQPGWHYLQRGSGTQYLAGGGTVATLLSPSAADVAIVIEKLDRATSVCSWSGVPKNTTTNETATLALGGSLSHITSLFAWRSTFFANGGADPDAGMFQFMGALPVTDGAVTLAIAVNEVWTLTTVASTKGAAPLPPNSTSFPLTWADSFDAVPLAQEPRYLSDMNGNFEVVEAAQYGRNGRVLRQMTPQKPVIWIRDDTTPHAIIGDSTWVTVNVSADVWVAAGNETAAIAAHCHGLNVDNTACLWLRVTAGGGAGGGGGEWAVFAGAAAMSNSSFKPAASGALAFAPLSWMALAIHANATAATLWANGALLAILELGAIGAPTAGFAGLGVAAYGHMSVFDNLAISATVPPPPPPPPPCAGTLPRRIAAGAADSSPPCAPLFGRNSRDGGLLASERLGLDAPWRGAGHAVAHGRARALRRGEPHAA